MNTLQRTFKFLKEKKDRADRFDIIPAVQCWSADRRVSQLLKLWLVEKRVVDQWKFEKPKTEYKVTDLWLNTIVGDVKPPKPLPKPKKTQEESLVKKECEAINIENAYKPMFFDYDIWKDKNKIKVRTWYQPVKEYTPPIKHTTFIWKIVYMYDVRMSL